MYWVDYLIPVGDHEQSSALAKYWEVVRQEVVVAGHSSKKTFVRIWILKKLK